MDHQRSSSEEESVTENSVVFKMVLSYSVITGKSTRFVPPVSTKKDAPQKSASLKYRKSA